MIAAGAAAPYPDRFTFGDLAAWLNAYGHQTGYGTRYQGGRGVARLVHAPYTFAGRLV